MSDKKFASSPIVRKIFSWLTTPVWVLRGRPHPAPPHIKRKTVINIANDGNFKAFVETGTYRGDMVLDICRRTSIPVVKSIELETSLALSAQQRFATDPRVEIIIGDSGTELQKLMPSLPSPALFWLDGHYSGGVTALGDAVTPIYDELKSIGVRNKATDVVLIDDIRLFNGRDGYPDKRELLKFISKINSNWICSEVGDFLKIGHAEASRKAPS